MITIMEKKVAYYLRTSHYLQNISTQVDKIEDGWKIYKDEGVSGRIEFSSRPSGRRLLQDLKENRISQVKVLRIDRLGRNVQDILDTINTIHSFGVPINSLSEGITTLDDKGNVTPTTGLLVNVLSSLSEFFYHQNREKMLTGIQLTRQKNPEKYKGRLPGSNEDIDKYMNKPKTKKMLEMLQQGNSVRSIVRILECSPNSIYKLKKLSQNVLN
jgi:DNA invertase Pin-like site-specific DNA recombinase